MDRSLHPQDIKALKELAKIHKDLGNIHHSQRYFTEVLKINPTDYDANHGLKDLAAMHTISAGNWEDEGSYRSKIKDEEQANLFEKEARSHKTTEDLEQLLVSLQKKVADNPDNIKYLRDLAELFAERKEFKKAIAEFENAIEKNPHDMTLQEFRMNMVERELNHEIFQVEKSLYKNPNDSDLIENIEILKTNRRQFLMKEYQAKVKQYPNNLHFRFNLAKLYFENHQIDPAIEEFQQSIQDPNNRLKAINYLGLCFHHKKMYDLAINQFNKALNELDIMNDFKKEVLYNLGHTYLEIKKNPDALKIFSSIYEADISYKDVAQLIEKLYRENQ